MKKIKKMLSNLYSGIAKWTFKPGRNTILGVGIAFAVIALIVLVVCLLLGCVGSVIAAAVSLPALLLMLAFNWVVLSFGGPSLGYLQACGIIILTVIVISILHTIRK